MANDNSITPLELLKQVVGYLRDLDGTFAIAGGLAASYYRAQPRLTNDVDIALAAGSIEQCKEIAIHIIEAMGYDAALGWIAGGEHKRMNAIALVIGRIDKDNLESTIDFLLPVFPWVEQAVPRAQDNLIDFGFARLPTITPEDIIIAKAFALENESHRFQDLDDIKSILTADNQLDLSYLVTQFEKLELTLPAVLNSFLPEVLKRLSK